jgi:hypothetical protein
MSLGGGGGGSRIVVAKAEGVSFAAGVRAGDVLTRVVRLPAADRFKWRAVSARAEHRTGLRRAAMQVAYGMASGVRHSVRHNSRGAWLRTSQAHASARH